MATRSRHASDTAYEQIKRQIVTLELGPGARVDEENLAKSIGVSRTPIREALMRLRADGLVVVGPRSGYYVLSIDLPHFRELSQANHIVVRAVTELLVASIDDQGLAQLEEATRSHDEAVATGDSANMSETNAQLHILEARLAGNSYLEEMATRVHTHLQCLAFVSFGGSDYSTGMAGHHERVHADHWGFLDALRERDREKALAVATGHATLFHDRVVEFLAHHNIGDLSFEGIGPVAE